MHRYRIILHALLSIITDGELYGHLQNLLDTVSVSLDELQTELGLSEEELKALLEKAAAVDHSSGMSLCAVSNTLAF